MPMMRTCKGGGCSLCNATDANVGKRRCNHVLDNESIEVRQEKRTNFVDISGRITGENQTLIVKAKIKSFISSLSNGLSKKEQEDVLSALREG